MAGNQSDLGLGAPRGTTSIVNAYSSGGYSTNNVHISQAAPRTLNSGALTAAALSTLVNISTAGQMPYLTCFTNDSTARTIRLQVILDGVTVFDATSDTISGSGWGLIAVGVPESAGTTEAAPIRWNASCVIKVASSLTETDKVGIAYKVV